MPTLRDQYDLEKGFKSGAKRAWQSYLRNSGGGRGAAAFMAGNVIQGAILGSKGRTVGQVSRGALQDAITGAIMADRRVMIPMMVLTSAASAYGGLKTFRDKGGFAGMRRRIRRKKSLRRKKNGIRSRTKH